MAKFELEFRDDEPSTGRMPVHPGAWVRLAQWSQDERSNILLTPEAASLPEFEAQVRLLKQQLDNVLVQAKRRFGV